MLDAAHRTEILHAIVEGGDYGDFREALITALLENEATRNIIVSKLHDTHRPQVIDKIHGGGNRGEMITKLHENDTSRGEVVNDLLTNHLPDLTGHIPTNDALRKGVIDALLGDAANRHAIAQAFVDSPDFRAVLVRLLETGRYAINITRMVWHSIDGADGARFWTVPAAQIVTKASFDHLLEKTAAGYQAISSLTRQRGNFRAAFADGNQVGKDGIHLGSAQAN